MVLSYKRKSVSVRFPKEGHMCVHGLVCRLQNFLLSEVFQSSALKK